MHIFSKILPKYMTYILVHRVEPGNGVKVNPGTPTQNALFDLDFRPHLIPGLDVGHSFDLREFLRGRDEKNKTYLRTALNCPPAAIAPPRSVKKPAPFLPLYEGERIPVESWGERVWNGDEEVTVFFSITDAWEGSEKFRHRKQKRWGIQLVFFFIFQAK